MLQHNILQNRKIWCDLNNHWQDIKDDHFENYSDSTLMRAKPYETELEGIRFDYSHNLINDETISLLCKLAGQAGLAERKQALFGGEKVNVTENRSVLHTLMRANDNAEPSGALKQARNTAADILSGIERLTCKIHSEERFKNIINIGIGGSDVGPRLVCKALSHLNHHDMNVQFLSNIDPVAFHDVMNGLKAEETLFIVVSKSFKTQETLTNALSAKRWLKDNGVQNIDEHFCGISSDEKAAADFGIKADQFLFLPDWIGGRYSLWSSVGLSIALAIGFENFTKLLQGAQKADEHFLNTPTRDNIPALMALIGVWYRNFLGLNTHAILPYCDRLQLFPQYMQQLDMESNGKQIDMAGRKIEYGTAPVILGGVGTDAQHTFFQLLHQGQEIIPCDFIACERPLYDIGDHHKKLISNVIGQAKALMNGKKNDRNIYKNFDGHRPSNILWLKELKPENLGMLIALYEHKIFTQGVIWNINSFDQYGVELGKSMAREALKSM